MSSEMITLLSGLGVAFLGGFWAWLQSRENRRGDEAKAAGDAALRLMERMEANLRHADERADDLLKESETLRERITRLEDDRDETRRRLSAITEELELMRRRAVTSDNLLQIAMRHIRELQADFKKQFPGVKIRQLPKPLQEYKWQK